MGTTSTFFGGSGGGGAAQFATDILGESCNYTWKRDGNVRVHVIGAGGGGGACCFDNSNGGGSGGGAGGYARKEFEVTAGETTCIIVGAGGNCTRNGCGGTGGCSCLTYGAHTLVANGGGGGFPVCDSNVRVCGGVGGTATGGDYNGTGGRGGCITCGVSGSHWGVATGGGAIAFYTNPGPNGGCARCVCQDMWGVGSGAGLGADGCIPCQSGVTCFSSGYAMSRYPSGHQTPDGPYGLPQEVFKGIMVQPAVGQRAVSAGPCSCLFAQTGYATDAPVRNFYSNLFGAGGEGRACGGLPNCSMIIAGHGGFGAGGGGVSPRSVNCCGCIAKSGNGGCGGGGGGLGQVCCFACNGSGFGGNGVVVIEYL